MKKYLFLLLSLGFLTGCYTQLALSKQEDWREEYQEEYDEYAEEYYYEDTAAVAERADVYVTHYYVRHYPRSYHHIVAYDPYWDCWDCWDGGWNSYVSSGFYWGIWDYPWGYPYFTYYPAWRPYWNPYYGYYDPFPYYYSGHKYYDHARFERRPFSKRVAGRSNMIIRNPRSGQETLTMERLEDANVVRPARAGAGSTTVSAANEKTVKTRPPRVVDQTTSVQQGKPVKTETRRPSKREQITGNNETTKRTTNRTDTDLEKPVQKVHTERKYFGIPVPNKMDATTTLKTTDRRGTTGEITPSVKKPVDTNRNHAVTTSKNVKSDSKSNPAVRSNATTSDTKPADKSSKSNSKVSPERKSAPSKTYNRPSSTSTRSGSSGSISRPSRSSSGSSSGRVSSGSSGNTRSSGSSSGSSRSTSSRGSSRGSKR